MKKTVSLLCLAIALFFAACKKNAVDTADTTANTTQLQDEAISPQAVAIIQSLKGMNNQDVKKVAFGLLSPSDKRAIWLDNIKTVSVNFNTQQKVLVAEFAAYLTVQLFEGKPTLQVAIFRDQWLTKAEKIFSADQIKAIAFQLYTQTDQTSGIKINAAGGGGEKPDCNCNAGSAYSCSSNTSVCSSQYFTSCTKSTLGCGFGWVWPCDNICYDFGG